LGCDDSAVALEAALAFAHWRVRLHPSDLRIDRWRLAVTAGAVSHGSPLRPWAAASVALAWFGPYGVVPLERRGMPSLPIGEAATRSQQPIRPACVRLLLPGLNRETVERIIRLGLAENDLEVSAGPLKTLAITLPL
jgi:hypothetical protein